MSARSASTLTRCLSRPKATCMLCSGVRGRSNAFVVPAPAFEIRRNLSHSPSRHADAAPSKAATPTSSVAAGTALRGINYFQGKPDPVALEDHEYPDWLWTCLETGKSADGPSGLQADLFSKSKKTRRAAAKALAKQAALNPGQTKVIPLNEQTIDLSHNEKGSLEGAMEAMGERTDLRRAMRKARRATIKEDNYLRSSS